MDSITPKDVKRKLDSGEKIFILDVRQPEEYDEWHIPGSVNIPLSELPFRIDELPEGMEIVAVCLHGYRSARAQKFLEARGIRSRSMEGGISEWPEWPL